MFLYAHWTHLEKIEPYGHFGPLTWFFFQNFLSLFNHLSIDINEFLVIIFNFTPLNGNYLYLPFFSYTGAKEEKCPFQRALETFAQEQLIENFFWGTRVYWFRKTKNIAVRTFVPQTFLLGVIRPDYSCLLVVNQRG